MIEDGLLLVDMEITFNNRCIYTIVRNISYQLFDKKIFSKSDSYLIYSDPNITPHPFPTQTHPDSSILPSGHHQGSY